MPPAARPRHRRQRPNDSAARGRRGELVAVWMLRLKGYRILARRFRAGAGEIDLIAARGDVIAFVEVKARRQMDDARAAITQDKQRRIASAAGAWLARNPEFIHGSLRLDAVFVGELSWAAVRSGRLPPPVHVTDIAPLAFRI